MNALAEKLLRGELRCALERFNELSPAQLEEQFGLFEEDSLHGEDEEPWSEMGIINVLHRALGEPELSDLAFRRLWAQRHEEVRP